MNQDKCVFAQVVEFLSRSKFNHMVAKYKGDNYIKSYSTWNQFLVLLFGQLSRFSGLRGCVIVLQAHSGKLYH